MKSVLKRVCLTCIPILLPVLCVVLFFSLIPSYDTPEARAEDLISREPGIQIISEETQGTYLIVETRSGSTVGYGMYHKTLGKWRFEHITQSTTGGFIGHFYQGDDLYLILVSKHADAAQVGITYIDSMTGEKIHEQMVATNGKTMLIVLADDVDGTPGHVVYFDQDGNVLS